VVEDGMAVGDAAATADAWRRLTELGLVEFRDGAPEPVEPDTALIRAIEEHRAGTLRQVRQAAALEEAALALVTVYRPAALARSEPVEAEYLVTHEAKMRAVTMLDSTTRESSAAMHTRLTPDDAALARGLAQDAAMTARGVRLRNVYPHALLGEPRAVRYFDELGAAGVEVRLADEVPCDMIIRDGLSACLPDDPAEPARSPMLVVHSRSVVRALAAFYDDCWQRAVPHREPRRTGAAGLSPHERVVIRLLALGLSDEQIARKTGVHRRTVQRGVARLMERLRAGSRFEAGLRLAQDPELSRMLPRPRSRPPQDVAAPYART
jgi:DNA-binding CsgD family transcriptional regulator